MKNKYSHIILYSKNWYKKTDTILDLNKILGQLYPLYPEHISLDSILHILLEIVWKYYIENNCDRFIQIFDNFFKYKKELNISIQEMIKELLSIISLLQVNDTDKDGNLIHIIELDNPDYTNILPKNSNIIDNDDFYNKMFGGNKI